MAADEEDRNPLDVLQPGDLDALLKPAEDERGPALSGELGGVKAPWVGAEESWRATATGEVEVPQDLRGAAFAGPEGDPDADAGGLGGARLSDIDLTAAARAASALPPRDAARRRRIRSALVALIVLAALGVIGTLWLLDLRDEYLHRQKLADLRDRDETSTRFQLASLLFGADDEPGAAAPSSPAGPTGEQPTTAEPADALRNVERAGGATERDTEQAAGTPGEDAPPAIDDNPFGEPGATGGAAAAGAPAPRARDQLSELLEGADAVDGDRLRAEREAKPEEDKVIVLEGEQFNRLPEQPSRAQVKTALDAVAGAVRRCGQGAGGQILIRIEVAGFTGRVTGAQVVSEQHQGTSLATCAARAVRAAKFPNFSKDSISIKYPFDL